MPTLESTDKIAPKSILRHRPIGESTTDLFHTTHRVIPRASRPPVDPAEVVTEWRRERSRKEAADTRKRHVKDKPLQLAKVLYTKLTLVRSKKGRHQAHPLFYLGVGMVVAMLLWIMLSAFCGWLGTALDDMRYGRPRTFQEDAWVGHNEQAGIPSHFIAINLNRHIEIIEFPGGDPSRAKVYLGPQLYGTNDELVPVTLQFIDVNKNHKPDMLVNFQGTRFVFINDQDGFRPMNPAERPQIEEFLQHQGQ